MKGEQVVVKLLPSRGHHAAHAVTDRLMLHLVICIETKPGLSRPTANCLQHSIQSMCLHLCIKAQPTY